MQKGKQGTHLHERRRRRERSWGSQGISLSGATWKTALSRPESFSYTHILLTCKNIVSREVEFGVCSKYLASAPQGKKKKSSPVEFANSHGINTPTMAHFKPPTGSQVAYDNPENITTASWWSPAQSTHEEGPLDHAAPDTPSPPHRKYPAQVFPFRKMPFLDAETRGVHSAMATRPSSPLFFSRAGLSNFSWHKNLLSAC